MRTAKVRALDGRWRSWAPSWLASHRPSRLTLPQRAGTKTNGSPAAQRDLARRPSRSGSRPPRWCFAVMTRRIWGVLPSFCEHPAFGPVVRAILDSASVLCGDVLGQEGRPRRSDPGSANRPRSTPSFTISARSSAWSWPRSGCSRSFSTSRFPRRGSASATASASCRRWSSGACTRWSSFCRSRWRWRPTAPS